MKLRSDQARVSVQFEPSVNQHGLMHGWEVVYKVFLFFPILRSTSSERATVHLLSIMEGVLQACLGFYVTWVDALPGLA